MEQPFLDPIEGEKQQKLNKTPCLEIKRNHQSTFPAPPKKIYPLLKQMRSLLYNQSLQSSTNIRLENKKNLKHLKQRTNKVSNKLKSNKTKNTDLNKLETPMHPNNHTP